MPTLAARLKKARLALKLTQAQLAEEVKRRYPSAGVTQQNIASLEKGRTKKTAFGAEIAEVLKVHVEWLVLGKGVREADKHGISVTDPKLIAALKLMQPMAEYQKDQVIKILNTLSEPSNSKPNNNNQADNG